MTPTSTLFGSLGGFWGGNPLEVGYLAWLMVFFGKFYIHKLGNSSQVVDIGRVKRVTFEFRTGVWD
jgi:hypothetical protein